MEKLFGSTLINGAGDKVATSTLDGKTAVGVYFSAHWCPPCRGFTPQLVKTVETIKKAKDFEVVFVSSDRSQKDFDAYFGTMTNFLALPFEDRATKEALSKQFKVNGIPTFVVLDGAGNIITADGRSDVSEDPEGARFPWRPPTFDEALGTTFVRNGGETVERKDLAGKTLGIYFSAHWCPPCRGFTPKLIETYKSCKAAGKDFEIIFASSDKNEEEFGEYFAEMPWLAVPFSDRARKGALSKLFSVEGIPHLVVVDPEGNIINGNARGAVAADSVGENFPWVPAPANDLEAEADGINDHVSVVLLMEGCPAAMAAAGVKAVTNVAAAALARAKAEKEEPMCFFYATGGDGVVEQITEICKLPTPTGTPRLLILDIPDNGGFYLDTEIRFEDEAGAEAAVTKMIEAYKAKSLTRKQLRG
eukprot:CAMPEP_0114555932 /NCGR_PEP_ID=MMETSP0114-20121206/9011_1 /TAXON_ID=31324 /ORGANISM="Goniomonas sp, Strain m" /LENGTH=418 /DNA_ID=CAMNT_0001741087 /DNA_START=21 /DNA_END=1277 /DNA_ORIENTATION=+